MYQQPQPVPNQAPDYLQPQPATPPQQQGHSFSPDGKTVEILQAVHPELANAMICLAIKKFSASEDYLNYFIRDEFKDAVAQEAQNVSTTNVESTPTTTTNQASAISFSNW